MPCAVMIARRGVTFPLLSSVKVGRDEFSYSPRSGCAEFTLSMAG